MASDSRTRCISYCNPHSNFFTAISGPDKLAGTAQDSVQDFAESVSIISSHVDTFVAICTPTLTCAPALSSTKNLFQQLITTYTATLKFLEQSQTAQS